MEPRRILFPWILLIFQVNFAACKFTTETIFRLLSDTKAELARSFFKRELLKKEAGVLNFNHTALEELNVPTTGENVRIFRSANESFLYDGATVLHLQIDQNQKSRYSLHTVHDVRLEEGAVFFKNGEWKNKTFLVICYQRAFCEIRVSSATIKSNLRMKIDAGTLPLDVSFFATQDDLYLILVRDPVVIYKWTGTYFNEDYHLDTTGAQSVATFQDGDKSVIVVAQNLRRNKVYSKVYIRKNDHIELFQLLPTNQALRVLHFSITQGDDVLSFIFVLNQVESSSIFWWTGKEFVLWKSLENIFGQRIVYVGRIQSEVFFFISDKNKIYVYHPTVTSFDLMQIITFDQEVVGIDLKLEKDEMPMLVLLTGSVLDPYFKVNLILLQVNFVPVPEEKNKTSDGILQCLSNLERHLTERGQKLDRIAGKLFDEDELDGEDLKMVSLDEAVTNVGYKIEEIEDKWKELQEEMKKDRRFRYHVYGDVKIGRMTAEQVDVEKLNGKPAEFDNYVSLTKDQTLTGLVRLNTLSAEELTAPSINGVAVEDILVSNKKIQRITGDYTLASLTAKEIKFGPEATINGVPYSDIVTSGNSENLIQGTKTFRALKAKQIDAEFINDIPSEEWLAKVLPIMKGPSEEEVEEKEEPLNFTSLTIQNLSVSTINGIPWEDFLDSLESLRLPPDNETIKGNVTVRGMTKVRNVKTKKINGIPVADLIQRSVFPNITCKVKTPKKIKSLPLDLSPAWDDNFIKEVLNEPGSPYEDNIVYFPGTEIIDGDFRVSAVFLKNPLNVSGTMIEDLDHLKDRYWMKSEDQVISVPVEFTNGFSVMNSIMANRTNGKSLNDFVWTDRLETITGSIVFEEDVEVDGNVTLAPGVKQEVDLKRLSDSTVKQDADNFVSGHKRFLGTLTAKNLLVDIINGVDVKDFEKFAKNHVSDDEIVAEELVVYGDLNVENGVRVNFINDVDFNETVSGALTWNDPDVLEKASFQSLTVKNLEVDVINGVKIEDHLPKLWKTEEKDVYVVIEGNFQLPQLNAVKVNGINFDKYINQIFQVNETSTIRGEKIFKDMVTVTGNLKGTLNEYNISHLEKIALSKTKPQTITGVYTVEELKSNDIDAEIIDGVPTSQLLFQDETEVQVINSDVAFTNIAVVGDVKAEDFMNGCDLQKVTDVNFEKVSEFETLDIRGNLSWESPLENVRGLDYFLSNVVTTDEDDVIVGSIVFENDVVVGNISGSGRFNDVDVEFLADDAVYRSRQEQEISVPVTFKGAVKAKNIEILNNVLIDSINGVDITDFEGKLVKKSSDVVVRGKKIFKSGFSANHFDAESVNGARTDQIVFYDDLKGNSELRLPPTTFSNLNVFNDLKVFRVNGYPLNQMFEEKLSKSQEQIMNGIFTVVGNVTIEGDGNIQRINDVNIEETILTDGEVSAKVITGDIEFRDTISIADNLEVDYINGHNMTALLEKALMVDDDAIIEGDVIFANNLTIYGDVDVNETVNGCDLRAVARMNFSDGSDATNLEIRKSLKEAVDKLTNLTAAMSNPIVFMYLEEVAKVDLQLPNIYGSVANRYNNSVEINFYGMNYGDCGLPTDCYCPAQTNLLIETMKPASLKIEANSARFFKFHHQELGVEVKVSTNTVSYSSRCKRRDEGVVNEATSISWKKFEEDSEDVVTQKIFKGFLSDVKFFKLGDSVYIIMAFYFHPSKNETHNLDTIVYELNVVEGSVKKVDEIPSRGTQVLEVFWTSRGVILVIGNSFDSERYTDSVNSAIYRFNEYENKFELLRFVKTHGVLSIKSMRYKKTSFVFFVQKQTWPLLILKYNPEYDNYYFSQKLDTTQSIVRSNFLSASALSTSTEGYSGDLFFAIVLSDDSFRLLKYKHIEGFVEESYQEQNNIRVLQPFWIGSTQYLLGGSASDVSKIYKFIEQGL